MSVQEAVTVAVAESVADVALIPESAVQPEDLACGRTFHGNDLGTPQHMGLPSRHSTVGEGNRDVAADERVKVTTGSHNRNRRRALAKSRKLNEARLATAHHLAGILPKLTGLDTDLSLENGITVHRRIRSPTNLAAVQAIQTANLTNANGFISLTEIKSVIPDILYLNDGYNVLVDHDSGDVFGIVYYRHLKNLTQPEQERILDIMSLTDSVTRTTANIIKTNGASVANGNSAKPHGLMCEYGWHQSYRKGGVIERYAARNTKAAKDTIITLDEQMASVARHFEERFTVLYGAAARANITHATDHHIPRFDQTKLDTEFAAGMNMFSTTRAGFCNTAHRDRDTSPFNIGAFFAGPVSQGRFARQLVPVGSRLHGGEFYWAEYGVIVGHAKHDSWAEVIWRGHKDYHGTLSCWLEPGNTFDQIDRWGSSCQITGGVQNRIRLLQERDQSTGKSA